MSAARSTSPSPGREGCLSLGFRLFVPTGEGNSNVTPLEYDTLCHVLHFLYYGWSIIIEFVPCQASMNEELCPCCHHHMTMPGGWRYSKCLWLWPGQSVYKSKCSDIIWQSYEGQTWEIRLSLTSQQAELLQAEGDSNLPTSRGLPPSIACTASPWTLPGLENSPPNTPAPSAGY